jgi:hypothetical protein
MSRRHLTQSEYALQQVVALFGELLPPLEEAGLPHTYQEVFRFCELKNISYLVLHYLRTGEPRFEEWVKQWFHAGEV